VVSVLWYNAVFSSEYDSACNATNVLTCTKSLLLFNHCICTFDFFFTFVSCILTVTLHIVDVRLTCLNKYYLLTYLLTYLVTYTEAYILSNWGGVGLAG